MIGDDKLIPLIDRLNLFKFKTANVPDWKCEVITFPVPNNEVILFHYTSGKLGTKFFLK